jgi:Leucine-rich repeat (LRR) protein
LSKISGFRCFFTRQSIEKNDEILIEIEPSDVNLEAIIEVHFTDSSIYSLPPKIFSKFKNLKSLSVAGQSVQEVKIGTFKDARNLERLDLPNNFLTHLHDNFFNGAENLKTLYLHSNRIERIDVGAFNNLLNLEFINLWGNQLRSLGREMFKENSNLRTIYLNSNKLENIHHQTFSHLPNLTSLFLRDNLCINQDFINEPISRIEAALKNCEKCDRIQETKKI